MQKNIDNSRVSIVIPVYNEAANLPACLDAIAAQTVRPFEVIVVDNNSSDDSALVAAEYSFVRVIHEPRQGVVHARDTGFRAAHGSIIGRIDADTVIATDWVETLLTIFADRSVDVVSGRPHYNDMSLAPICNIIDLALRRHLARVLGREVGIQGANMAMRRKVWLAIKGNVCRHGGLHEDLDIGIHANKQGFNVVFDESLVVSLGFRQAESRFEDYCEYMFLNSRTYAQHGLKSYRHFYPVIYTAILFYFPIYLAHRGYDAQLKRFSLGKLVLAPQEARVNPATFVD
jgi:glycosyltransferase involved in cell wall biosynthesis